VTHSNYRQFPFTLPPKPDPATATPEDWLAHHASLTDAQRAAQKIAWVHTVAGMFGNKFAAAERKEAAKFACCRERVRLFRAFDEGRTKAEMIAELWELYASRIR
jgi:hypothetical protein